MNTTHEPPASDIAKLEADSPLTKLAATAAALEEQLQNEQDARKEERFYWIFACILLADVIAFPLLGWAWIPIFLLELIFLIALANWLGVDGVVVFFERLFYQYLKWPRKGDD